MSDTSEIIRGCIDRLQAGDESARDHLLTCASERLVRLTRKMLKDFPGVRRWEQTDDVMQNALLRLCRALRDVKPATPLDFFRLAALQIRRELLDLARHYAGPYGLLANHATDTVDAWREACREPSDDTFDPARLAEWTRFHDVAGTLPSEEREVFDLLFYQGLSQDEAAQLLGYSERTIKRRWQSARLILFDSLEGRIPGG